MGRIKNANVGQNWFVFVKIKANHGKSRFRAGDSFVNRRGKYGELPRLMTIKLAISSTYYTCLESFARQVVFHCCAEMVKVWFEFNSDDARRIEIAADPRDHLHLAASRCRKSFRRQCSSDSGDERGAIARPYPR